MIYNQKLSDLMYRNEDWLLSRILSYAKDTKDTDFFQLITHSWQSTITSFNKLLDTPDFKTYNNTQPHFSNLEDFVSLTEFITGEVLECIKKNIDSYIYLGYLKVFKCIYKEMFDNANLTKKEKKLFSDHIDINFDCFETTFIKYYSKIKEDFYQIESAQTQISMVNRGVFNCIPLPLLIVDESDKIIDYNQQAIKNFKNIFNNAARKLEQLSIHKGFDQIYSGINQLRQSNKKEVQLELQLHATIAEQWHIVSLCKISNSKNIIVSFLNINNQYQKIDKLSKEKEREKESNRLKTTFLANMSHEIRTPMNAIVGFSELISISNPTKEEREEYLNLIKKSSNDLLNIIEDIIDIAKIEAQQLKINTRDTNLYELFSEIKRIYEEVLIKHGKEDIALKLCIPEDETQLIIRTDPKRLKQVVSNLLGNAIKFTDKGSIDIGYKKAQNRIIYFFVKDTGIGIPYERQKNVFDRFVQVDNAYSKNASGTGLGLTISKNIVNILGGNIWVSSQPCKGSNFYFYLPNIPAAGEEKNPASDTLKTTTSVNFKGKNILIAEDQDANFIYLQKLFKESGANLYRAQTGIEAISSAENLNLDIILMDIKMPEINGIEAAKYIKHIKPEIPIIALTAFAMEEDKMNCLKSGCEDYISKPVKKHTLYKILEKHLCKENKKVLG